MRFLAVGLLLFCGPHISLADEWTYVGTWRTTNRKLDGSMTCEVKNLGQDKWQGRFYGIWQGVPFDYTVPFKGRPSELQGTATIDGASYMWTGSITPGPSSVFKGTFGGSRYNGSFDLQEKPAQVATKPR